MVKSHLVNSKMVRSLSLVIGALALLSSCNRQASKNQPNLESELSAAAEDPSRVTALEVVRKISILPEETIQSRREVNLDTEPLLLDLNEVEPFWVDFGKGTTATETILYAGDGDLYTVWLCSTLTPKGIVSGIVIRSKYFDGTKEITEVYVDINADGIVDTATWKDSEGSFSYLLEIPGPKGDRMDPVMALITAAAGGWQSGYVEALEKLQAEHELVEEMKKLTPCYPE